MNFKAKKVIIFDPPCRKYAYRGHNLHQEVVQESFKVIFLS